MNHSAREHTGDSMREPINTVHMLNLPDPVSYYNDTLTSDRLHVRRMSGNHSWYAAR